MSKMTSRMKHSYDAEPAVLFRALGSAALGASATEGSSVIDIHKLVDAYWEDGLELADKRFDVVIVVEAVTVAAAVSLAVQVDDAADMASAVAVKTYSDPAVGAYTVPIDGDDLANLIANPSHMRILATTGVGDDLTYAAWLVQHAKA